MLLRITSVITIFIFRFHTHLAHYYSMTMKSGADLDGISPKITEDGSGIASAPGHRCPGITEPLGKPGLIYIFKV